MSTQQPTQSAVFAPSASDNAAVDTSAPLVAAPGNGVVVSSVRSSGVHWASRRGMRIVSRLWQALITLWITVTLLFFAQVLLPGDRATIYLNVYEGQSIERTAQELAPINKEFGFDRPLLVQYADYIGGVLKGNLGIALQTRRNVTTLIAEQIGATARLTGAAIVLAWLITLIWMIATGGRRALVSRFGSATEALVAGMPQYWLGLILLLLFAVRLDWFPVVSGASLSGIWLPALTLALPLAGFLGQAVRAEYERALRHPHVLSSRARGTSDCRVRVVHALRPALIPGITLSGWALGSLISGAVIVENIFSRPGIGALLVNAVQLKEFELISGIILIVSLVYVGLTFLTDWLYTLVDPRVRLRGEGES